MNEVDLLLSEIKGASVTLKLFIADSNHVPKHLHELVGFYDDLNEVVKRDIPAWSTDYIYFFEKSATYDLKYDLPLMVHKYNISEQKGGYIVLSSSTLVYRDWDFIESWLTWNESDNSLNPLPTGLPAR